MKNNLILVFLAVIFLAGGFYYRNLEIKSGKHYNNLRFRVAGSINQAKNLVEKGEYDKAEKLTVSAINFIKKNNSHNLGKNFLEAGYFLLGVINYRMGEQIIFEYLGSSINPAVKKFPSLVKAKGYLEESLKFFKLVDKSKAYSLASLNNQGNVFVLKIYLGIFLQENIEEIQGYHSEALKSYFENKTLDGCGEPCQLRASQNIEFLVRPEKSNPDQMGLGKYIQGRDDVLKKTPFMLPNVAPGVQPPGVK